MQSGCLQFIWRPDSAGFFARADCQRYLLPFLHLPVPSLLLLSSLPALFPTLPSSRRLFPSISISSFAL